MANTSIIIRDRHWINLLKSGIASTCQNEANRQIGMTQRLYSNTTSGLQTLFASFRYYAVEDTPIKNLVLGWITQKTYYKDLYPRYILLMVLGGLCALACLLIILDRVLNASVYGEKVLCVCVKFQQNSNKIKKIILALNITNAVFMGAVFLPFLITFCFTVAYQFGRAYNLQCELYRATHDILYVNEYTNVCSSEIRPCNGTDWSGLAVHADALQQHNVTPSQLCPSLKSFAEFSHNGIHAIDTMLLDLRHIFADIKHIYKFTRSAFVSGIITSCVVVAMLAAVLLIYQVIMTTLALLPFCCKSVLPLKLSRALFALCLYSLFVAAIISILMGAVMIHTAESRQDCDHARFNTRMGVGEGGIESLCLRLRTHKESNACRFFRHCMSNDASWDITKALILEDGRTFGEAASVLFLELEEDVLTCPDQVSQARSIIQKINSTKNCGIGNFYVRTTESCVCDQASPLFALASVCLGILFVCATIVSIINFILHHHHEYIQEAIVHL